MKHKPKQDRHKSQITYVRMAPELRREVAQIAKNADRSLGYQLGKLIELGLEQWRKNVQPSN